MECNREDARKRRAAKPKRPKSARKQAQDLGLKYFFTGKLCKRGHMAKWKVSGGCVECKREGAHRWYVNNIEKALGYGHKRRALKAGAEGSHTPADIKRIRKAQGNKCVYCKTSLDDGYHVDHIESLAGGGSNGPENLQLLCPTCNMSKGAADPVEFAQRIGLLP